MPIISLSGKARVGKDSFADVLVNEYGYERVSFADDLRDFCSRVFKINISDFLDGETKDKKFDVPLRLDFHHVDRMRDILITEYGYEVNYEDREMLEDFEGVEFDTPRHILRFVGTNMLRNIVDDEIWTKRVIEKIREKGKVVITDCRFETERDLMNKIGAILIKIKRNDDGNTREHEFDLGPDDEYDVIFENNGTLGEYKSNINLWYTMRKAELEYQYVTKLDKIK